MLPKSTVSRWVHRALLALESTLNPLMWLPARAFQRIVRSELLMKARPLGEVQGSIPEDSRVYLGGSCVNSLVLSAIFLTKHCYALAGWWTEDFRVYLGGSCVDQKSV